eukprot:scaffold5807_cov212-Skeletonema_menzelii.AAC.2
MNVAGWTREAMKLMYMYHDGESTPTQPQGGGSNGIGVSLLVSPSSSRERVLTPIATGRPTDLTGMRSEPMNP